MKNYLTIAIPTSDMGGKGAQFLRESFDRIARQTFRDFNVVITDNSRTDAIEKVCDEYKSAFPITYYRNWRNIGMTKNVNKALRKSTGKIIKILFLDDFLYDDNSLQNIVDAFDLEKDRWLVTACEHSKDGKTFYMPFYPKYSEKIYLGANTISSPSVLAIKNDKPLLFDTKTMWLMDCDYYERCYRAFGLPKILNTITVVNRVGDHQASNTLASKKVRGKEYRYILKKYHEKELLKAYDGVMTTSFYIKKFLRERKIVMRIRALFK